MSNHKQLNGIRERDIVLWVNISLLGVASLLLFYYVMMANSVAAKNYKVQTLRNKLEAMSEINGSLMSQKLALESPAMLLEFARSNDLVEARNIVYIFENSNVAQR